MHESYDSDDSGSLAEEQSAPVKLNLSDPLVFFQMYCYASAPLASHQKIQLEYKGKPVGHLGAPFGKHNFPYFFPANQEKEKEVSWNQIGKHLASYDEREIKAIATVVLKLMRMNSRLNGDPEIEKEELAKLLGSLEKIKAKGDLSPIGLTALLAGAAACEAGRGYTGYINVFATLTRIKLNHQPENKQKKSLAEYIKEDLLPKPDNFDNGAKSVRNATGFEGSQNMILDASGKKDFEYPKVRYHKFPKGKKMNATELDSANQKDKEKLEWYKNRTLRDKNEIKSKNFMSKEGQMYWLEKSESEKKRYSRKIKSHILAAEKRKKLMLNGVPFSNNEETSKIPNRKLDQGGLHKKAKIEFEDLSSEDAVQKKKKINTPKKKPSNTRKSSEEDGSIGFDNGDVNMGSSSSDDNSSKEKKLPPKKAKPPEKQKIKISIEEPKPTKKEEGMELEDSSSEKKEKITTPKEKPSNSRKSSFIDDSGSGEDHITTLPKMNSNAMAIETETKPKKKSEEVSIDLDESFSFEGDDYTLTRLRKKSEQNGDMSLSSDDSENPSKTSANSSGSGSDPENNPQSIKKRAGSSISDAQQRPQKKQKVSDNQDSSMGLTSQSSNIQPQRRVGLSKRAQVNSLHNPNPSNQSSGDTGKKPSTPKPS